MQNETLLISSGVGSGNLLTCILQILVQIKKMCVITEGTGTPSYPLLILTTSIGV